MSDLLTLARYAAEREEKAAVLVLEDALEEAGWFTQGNAERVFDVLFAGWPPARPDKFRGGDDVREWFSNGFRAAERCEVALSLFGRKFLASIVTVLASRPSGTGGDGR